MELSSITVKWVNCLDYSFYKFIKLVGYKRYFYYIYFNINSVVAPLKKHNMQEEIHKELWDRDGRVVHQIREGLEAKKQKAPDPKLHQLISFVKSGIRIAGYCFLPFNLWVACFILILSEVVGIYEELV